MEVVDQVDVWLAESGYFHPKTFDVLGLKAQLGFSGQLV